MKSSTRLLFDSFNAFALFGIITSIETRPDPTAPFQPSNPAPGSNRLTTEPEDRDEATRREGAVGRWQVE